MGDILFPYTFAAIGVLFGLLFVIFGWRSNESDETSLTEHPTFKNLSALLAGSAVTILFERITETESLLMWYWAFTVTAILFFSLLSFFLAFLIARKRMQDFQPLETPGNLRIEAIVLSLDAVLGGIGSFREKLDSLLFKELYSQKMFFLGFTARLVRDFGGITDAKVTDFLAFIDLLIQDFVSLFLEYDTLLSDYRGCLYFYDFQKRILRFLTGIAPEGKKNQYTYRDFQVQGSLAGYALQNPGIVHCYPPQHGDPPLPFEPQEADRRYAAVIAFGIEDPSGTNEDVNLVLCIDCISESAARQKDYKKGMIGALGNLIAVTQFAARISPEMLRQWLDEQVTQATSS